jgi:formylglycine-generating enzyme required for sulfatase activity
MVHVNASGAPGGSYYIYKFESSRVDASASTQGTSTTRACSRAQDATGGGSAVEQRVSWNQADAACRAAGMRLCKVTRSGGAIVTDEWGFACQAGQTCSSGPIRTPAATARDLQCLRHESWQGGRLRLARKLRDGRGPGHRQSSEHVYDMSGNLAEWTDDRRDVSTPRSVGGRRLGTAIYTTRGGAFDSFFRGMACDFTGTQLAPDVLLP